MTPTPLSQRGSETQQMLNVLEARLKESPEDWELRKNVARLMYDRGRYVDAADVVWSAPEIPPVDIEIAFSARALAKGKPRRALRLLHAVLDQNRGKPVTNLALANALLHHGMVMEASRFYGAAVAEEPGLMDPEFEYWLMWVDEKQKLWGDWEEQDVQLEELPWVKRDQKLLEELDAKAGFKLTTPVKIPSLPESPAEILDEIGHVHHDPDPEVPMKAPPSIQFSPAAVEALGDKATIPGQRQEGDKFPAASGSLPSAPVTRSGQSSPPAEAVPFSASAPTQPLTADSASEVDLSGPSATGSSSAPAALPAGGQTRGVKLILPGNQAVSTVKPEGGPAAPAAPSIVLPEPEED